MAHVGDFLIFAAAAFSLASLILYLLAWRGKEHLLSLARRCYVVATGAAVAALVTLLTLILRHDYSVAYVYSYSSNDLPLGYLISSLWGGQEGTFLLWLFYTALFGLVMMRTAGKFEKGNMFFLNLFTLSLLLILIKKSPFELMPIFKEDGAGLNPLLQNFWMQIHPPIMFVGFAGVVFPFCFAMTALVERKYEIWSEAARRWTMFAWASLGISLVMGGYWAYETLGWGGFWAWDPVENSSFIPWIFLTAQVHSLFIKRQRRGLMRFSLVVTALTFWSVLYGTFLTRSGVLADFSVHSFVDLGINAFLISGLFTFIGIGVFLLLFRWREITPEKSFSSVTSRSYFVMLGIVFLFLGGILVLLGTSAPLITRFAENPSNVGLPYYFATMTPIAIGILLLIGIFPAFKWNDGMSRKKLLIAGLIAATLMLVGLLVVGVTYNPMYLALFASAAFALAANGWVVIDGFREGKFKSGYIAHVGLALGLIGAASANGLETKETLTLKQNVPLSAMGYELTFKSVVQTPKGFDCHVVLKSGDETVHAALPHEFPKNAEGVMKKPHVETYALYDLYLAPVSLKEAAPNQAGRLTLKKGEPVKLDKYEFTFNQFDLSGAHGDSEQSDSVMSVAALLTVAFDGKTESVAPRMKVQPSGIVHDQATFDNNTGSVTIAGVRPEDGGVVLNVAGSFVPSDNAEPASLVIEFSKKPLIQLFWLGAFIAFAGGISTMRRKKAKSPATVASNSAESVTVGSVSQPPIGPNVPTR
jgi:cytochrome c-type biogenesis protein CcmF